MDPIPVQCEWFLGTFFSPKNFPGTHWSTTSHFAQERVKKYSGGQCSGPYEFPLGHSHGTMVARKFSLKVVSLEPGIECNKPLLAATPPFEDDAEAWQRVASLASLWRQGTVTSNAAVAGALLGTRSVSRTTSHVRELRS